MAPKDILKKIRCKYILTQIFDNLSQTTKLKLILYNQNLMNQLKIKMKDYINAYSIIELEIIPKEHEYGKFINIRKTKNINNYYHIYFNDKKLEKITNEITEHDNVKKIRVKIYIKAKSVHQLFLNCRCIKKISFIKFNRNDFVNMKQMFYACTSLEELDISKLNTENVSDMSCMFYRCESLKDLNLSNFNTSNVTDMSYMFDRCSSLQHLNIRSFNTCNVTDMTAIFRYCSSLQELNISNFTTDKVIRMGDMFYECSSL